MPADDALERFSVDIHQELLSDAAAQPDGALTPDVYTQRMIEYLTEAGELDDGEVCYHRSRGVEVSGYSVDDEDEVLSLFVSIFTESTPPVTVPTADVDTAFKRLETFMVRCGTGYHREVEPASPAHDMALRVGEAVRRGYAVRLFVFTDGLIARSARTARQKDGPIAAYEVWDIERLHRLLTSGQGRETIRVNFEEINGGPLPCLLAKDGAADYTAYMLIVPATVLNEIYSQYGPRLLELNVRSFLQVRGKVNKGIRETILNEPEHFLAYNNGISATASEVEIVDMPGGGRGIRSATDFQIVNGGQTTASIHSAVKRDKADISRISVQAKLTVVGADRVGQFVPLVSRYANSQNKVNEADFSANDPYHVRLEELSRTIWAPAVEGSARQTKWFYERARGQYQDAIAREATPARQLEFKRTHPPGQKFTKTDLAKFVNSWDQAPEIVSRGSEKNFREFAIRLAKRGQTEPDERHFQRLVAKAILFRSTSDIVSKLGFAGYRANVVTYTVAYVSHATGQRVDLDAIWKRQAIPARLEETIRTIAPVIYQEITTPTGGGNVTEWCKRAASWDRIRNNVIQLPDLDGILVGGPHDATGAEPRSEPQDDPVVAEMMVVPAETWLRLSGWAKQTDNLEPWQRAIAYSVGRQLQRGRVMSSKQAAQLRIVLIEAKRLGFVAQVAGIDDSAG